MKTHTLKFTARIKAAKPISPPHCGVVGEDYYSAKKTLLRNGNNRERSLFSGKGVINIVNNKLHIVNNIAFRIFFSSSKAHMRTGAELSRAKAVAEFAGAAIDNALKEKIDRELSVMQRGENIASNRRRRIMLKHYLSEKPYGEFRGFYGARMQYINGSSVSSERGNDGFHSDIIHERQTKTTHTAYEQHSTQIIRQEGVPARAQDESARQIAEQVFNRIERKMRTDKERIGLF